ncbi:MAG: c-type cytochrome [Pedosphaera sp.]|nr:c-type cytochrome [Pedosphaera sp.]
MLALPRGALFNTVMHTHSRWLLLALLGYFSDTHAAAPVFRAGAHVADISPTGFPVRVNAMFTERSASKVTDPLFAKALALDDGTTRLVFCVVDTCMIPRDLIDQAKADASKATGIPTERMLVSATHTHSAPSAMGCLGSRVDPGYAAFLPARLTAAIVGAVERLAPARIGWAQADDWEHTFNRRWIRRPDKLLNDPFGQRNVRANMHPGHQSPDAIGPSGPVDPQLSVLAVQRLDGKPLALLANYSQHYYGSPLLSSDYYGRFARHIATMLEADDSFVGIMSQGTSGDQMWMDYGAPKHEIGYDAYAKEIAGRVAEMVRGIKWQDSAPLQMAERKLELGYRTPDEQRLAWARGMAAKLGNKLPQSQAEIYALEAIYLHERPRTELKVQALRIGELGIAALPNEVFAITGLKLKAQSPFPATFNIELANGAEGYIPPREQHHLGGYTTWTARTAGLETNAEPKIVEALLGLLEQVAGKPRRPFIELHGPYAEAVLADKPSAYWRLNEMTGPTAYDSTGANRNATYENGVAFFLPGAGSGTGISPKPQLTSSKFSDPRQINRAAHFAGGRLRANVPLGENYSVELWLWNGLPAGVRAVTGVVFARGEGKGDSLGITGQSVAAPGRLYFQNGAGPPLVGKSELALKDWHHVVLVRAGRKVTVHLDGEANPEISGEAGPAASAEPLHFGGDTGSEFRFEGKLDEIAVFDRALSSAEVAAHWKAAGLSEQRAAAAAERAREAKQVASRAQPPQFPASYSNTILALKPAVYWHLNTPDAHQVPDASPNKMAGAVEGGVSLSADAFATFNGGRIAANLPKLGNTFSVSCWFRNNTANTARPVTAYFFSRGPKLHKLALGDHLGVGGSHLPGVAGRLIFFNGNERDQLVSGRTVIPPGTWNHVVLVRDAGRVTAWLNGKPEFEGAADATDAGVTEFFIGARSDQFAPLAGHMAEFALFDRALTPAEAVQLHQASGQPAGRPTAAPPEKAVPPGITPAPAPAPLSPLESMRKIHLTPGFSIDLVASEPLTMDPVAIDWSPDGRLWIVEMADYPLGLDGKGKPGGRVRVLEDTDGDGRYDKSTIFADGLNFPTGLLIWRDGVVVTAAPEIIFLRDTDGDGKADSREVLISGLLQGNQQLRANGLRWGLDGWVYCAAGGHHRGHGAGNKLRSSRAGKDVAVGALDFRFKPDTGELEPESGPSQFGRNRDDWGHWFGTQNIRPLWHYVLADRYLRRNPHVAAPDPTRLVVVPLSPKVWPVSSPEKRFHSFNEAGHFTSACSGTIYRDELLFGKSPFGPANEMHAFTCEPFHNLVQRNIVTQDGVTFAARRAAGEEKSDFFASEDRWCRPVMTRTGPDGALWVVDMYRAMIEHPDWLPAHGRAELLPQYRLGDDRGRIYRVFPTGTPPRKLTRLDKLNTGELVAALDSPNEWQRDKAHMMLLWRADKAAAAPLAKLAADSPNPLARLQALCVLDGLGALSVASVTRALGDPHPGLRENALRLAEKQTAPEVIMAAAKLVDDPDAKVRLQLAFTLGEWNDPRAGEALGRLAVGNFSDSFLLAAVMSSAVPHTRALVEATGRAADPALAPLTEALVNLALGLNQRDALAALLAPTLNAQEKNFTAAQMTVFSQFLDMLGRRKTSLAALTTGDDALARQLAGADAMFTAAARTAQEESQPVARRAAAAGLLARNPSRRVETLALLSTWLAPRQPPELQRASISALAMTADASVPGTLLKGWPSFSPESRAAALDALFSRETWTFALLEQAQKDGGLSLDATRRSQLLKHSSSRIRDLAARVFNTAGTSSRLKIIEQFQPALRLTGNATRGEAMFTKLCINCHQRGGAGKEVGPDLRSVAAHPPEKLLANILDPSADVQPGFHAYHCRLADDTELYGLIAAETGNSITFKLADATTRVVLRTDIAELRGANVSLMPEGLEAGLSHQDMADLIQLLRSGEAKPRTSGKGAADVRVGAAGFHLDRECSTPDWAPDKTVLWSRSLGAGRRTVRRRWRLDVHPAGPRRCGGSRRRTSAHSPRPASSRDAACGGYPLPAGRA